MFWLHYFLREADLDPLDELDKFICLSSVFDLLVVALIVQSHGLYDDLVGAELLVVPLQLSMF